MLKKTSADTGTNAPLRRIDLAMAAFSGKFTVNCERYNFGVCISSIMKSSLYILHDKDFPYTLYNSESFLCTMLHYKFIKKNRFHLLCSKYLTIIFP